jgi:hypothetical protein
MKRLMRLSLIGLIFLGAASCVAVGPYPDDYYYSYPEYYDYGYYPYYPYPYSHSFHGFRGRGHEGGERSEHHEGRGHGHR